MELIHVWAELTVPTGPQDCDGEFEFGKGLCA